MYYIGLYREYIKKIWSIAIRPRALIFGMYSCGTFPKFVPIISMGPQRPRPVDHILYSFISRKY